MGMKSLKWEGIGTKNLFPHTSSQSPCRADLHKWCLAQSPSCDCGQRQTMNHTVDTCPLTTSEGGLNLLHEEDDDAVMWLESTATAALAKWTVHARSSIRKLTYACDKITHAYHKHFESFKRMAKRFWRKDATSTLTAILGDKKVGQRKEVDSQ